MTLDELKTLKAGEVVVITKVDKKITEYHNYQVGDELVFDKFMEFKLSGKWVGQIDFLRASSSDGQYAWVVSHFSYEIFHYIERKVKLERDNKLNSLGI
jgi:hypothetical protein